MTSTHAATHPVPGVRAQQDSPRPARPGGIVLLEPGLGEAATQWDSTCHLLHDAPELAGWTLLPHDRPGLGNAPARPDLTLTQLLATIDALLASGPTTSDGAGPAGTTTCAAKGVEGAGDSHTIDGGGGRGEAGSTNTATRSPSVPTLTDDAAAVTNIGTEGTEAGVPRPAPALVPRPLILVGHSWGGTLLRLWAALHRCTDARLVLVDPSWEHGPEDPDAHPAMRPFLAAQARLAALAHLHTPVPVPAGTASELRLFPHSLRLLARLSAAGRAPLTRATVVTTSRARGGQADHHRGLASSGARFLAARTPHHDIPRHDPHTVALAVRLVARDLLRACPGTGER